jgi:hypothetical protein
MPGSTMKLYVRTPLIQSLPLAKYANADVYMKLENTQPSGSFKMRGISNLIEKVLFWRLQFIILQLFNFKYRAYITGVHDYYSTSPTANGDL